MTKLQQKARDLKDAAKIGRKLASKRIENRFKASFVAWSMGISASMLCLLEKGRRRWTPELKQRFLKAIGL